MDVHFRQYESLKFFVWAWHSESLNSGIENFNCHVCGLEFGQSAELLEHINTNHQEGGVKGGKCPICHTFFEDEKILETHKSTIHGVKGNKCENCNKEFSETYRLVKHIRIVHEGVRDYKCESCDKAFGRPQHLRGMFYYKLGLFISNNQKMIIKNEAYFSA